MQSIKHMQIGKESHKLKKKINKEPDMGMPLSLKVKIVSIFADKDHNGTQHGERVYFSLFFFSVRENYSIYFQSQHNKLHVF